MTRLVCLVRFPQLSLVLFTLHRHLPAQSPTTEDYFQYFPRMVSAIKFVFVGMRV